MCAAGGARGTGSKSKHFRFQSPCLGENMQESLEALVQMLESYRGRDKIIRTLCYGSQLIGGILTRKEDGSWVRLGRSMLLLSAQLSHSRTVLRLFDDPSMLLHSRSYGLGAPHDDAALRVISVLSNMADQLYYPCEHVAWACDARLLAVDSEPWWTCSTALWSFSLLMGIIRSLRVLQLLRKNDGERSGNSARRRELLSILSKMADLGNAVHWMPAGFLWAGRLPAWLVGMLGTVSSLIGLLQASSW